MEIALMTIRALAYLFRLQGEDRAASALDRLAAGIEAGADVNEHMQTVADALNDDNPLQWDEAIARIEANSDW